MNIRRAVVASIAATIVPSVAGAQATPAPDAQVAVRAATRTYFDAFAAADADRFDAVITPSYRFLDPHGTPSDARAVFERSAAAHLEGSPPQGQLSISDIVVFGDQATDTTTWQTYAYAFVAGRRVVLRQYSAHALTLRRDPSGAWRVDTDRETEAHTAY